MAEVLVLVDGQGAVPSRNALELLGAARRLADARKEGGGAGVLEKPPTAFPEAVGAYGAARVLAVRHPLLTGHPPEICLAALQQVMALERYDLLFLPDDDAGREVAPRLAHRLGGAVVTEVMEVRCEGGPLAFRRQLYGGRCLG